LIEARTRDLSDDPFVDASDFERYCLETTEPLIRLSLSALASASRTHNDEQTLDSAIRHAGMAWAATGLIRAIPALENRGRCMMPLSLLDRHGVTRETMCEEHNRSALKNIVEEIAARAGQHLNSARKQAEAIDSALFPVFLPLSMAGFYLSTIRKSGFDPFHPAVQRPNNAVRALRLLYATWRKRC